MSLYLLSSIARRTSSSETFLIRIGLFAGRTFDEVADDLRERFGDLTRVADLFSSKLPFRGLPSSPEILTDQQARLLPTLPLTCSYDELLGFADWIEPTCALLFDSEWYRVYHDGSRRALNRMELYRLEPRGCQNRR